MNAEEEQKEKVVHFKQIKKDRKLLLISKYYKSLSLGHLLKEAQMLCELIETDLNSGLILKCKGMLKELGIRYSGSSLHHDNPIEKMRIYLEQKI